MLTSATVATAVTTAGSGGAIRNSRHNANHQSSRHQLKATRTVQLTRSRIGFGFTINGQSPCVLSCIVPNSPADKAGLKPGDALLAVNDRPVEGLPHDDVAISIAQCGGVLTLLLLPTSPAPSTLQSTTVAVVSQHQQQQQPPPPPPRHQGSLQSTSDPRVIGPEARYEQVVTGAAAAAAAVSRQKLQDNSNSSNRRQTASSFVLSYIGSLSIPCVAPAASPQTAALAASLTRLKSEARDVSLAVLNVLSVAASTTAAYPEDNRDSQDHQGSGTAAVTLTGCSGRVLLRLWRSQLLACSKHPDDARYFGLLCSGSANGIACQSATVHGFFANPRLAGPSGHGGHAKWAAAFGLASVAGNCCAAFPPDSNPVLAALKPLLVMLKMTKVAPSQASAVAGGFDGFKIPAPPPQPVTAATNIASAAAASVDAGAAVSLFRRFAREASGSFRRLRRRSVALSVESLTSSASESEYHPPMSTGAAEPVAAGFPGANSSRLNGSHLTAASSERNLSSLEPEPQGSAANCVAKWATGLRHLLADSHGVKVFTDFLRLEFSEENIIFWLAVEDYKRLRDPDELRATANNIAATFIGPSAPSSVNVDSATVAAIAAGLSASRAPSPALFESAQEHIFNLMRLDSYARFLKSQVYKDSLLCELRLAGGVSTATVMNATNTAAATTSQTQSRLTSQVSRSSVVSLQQLATNGSHSNGNTASLATGARGKRQMLNQQQQQQQQHRTSKGFLASLMRGRSSKRYTNQVPSGASATDNPVNPKQQAVDILVGFRQHQPQTAHAVPVHASVNHHYHQQHHQQGRHGNGNCVWLAVRAQPQLSLSDALQPAISRYGLLPADPDDGGRALTAFQLPVGTELPWQQPVQMLQTSPSSVLQIALGPEPIRDQLVGQFANVDEALASAAASQPHRLTRPSRPSLISLPARFYPIRQ